MATASTDGAQQSTQQEDGTTAQSIVNMHRYKMQPPAFTGEYGTFEEWKYKFQAYMGRMDSTLPQLLENAENSTTIIRDADLVAAASTTEEANKWKVEATDLRYILINICSGAAATTCRQHQSQNGFEIYQQLCVRFSVPLGTRLMGYLTKLLKPTFDMNNFEETFSQWEFELYKVERDNGQALPESVKIAVILNETKGPLQQHLQLLAGQSPSYNTVRTTIMEYYRATTAFNKLKQQTSSSVNTSHGGGTAPMDISAIKGKGKGYKGKGKYKGERQGKGYRRYKGERQGKGCGRHKGKEKGYKGYGKGQVGQGNPFSMKGQQKQEHKGRRKGAKGKRAQDKCYRCGQQGHIAREAPTATTEQHDTTYQWYEDPHGYDNYWWHSTSHQGQQLSLPAPYTAATHNTPTVQRISGVHCNEPIIIAHVHDGNAGQAINYSDIMVSTGVATHVCPPWFAQEFPILTLTADKEPQLRTATDDEIKLYGYKLVYMHNVEGQPVVIPFYVCDVPQPIVAVSRLEEQGFELTFKEGQPTVRHAKGFNTTLVKKHSLYYLRTTVIPIHRITHYRYNRQVREQ